jgi:hypothetical protein
MVRDLQAAIRQLDDAAYQFSITIAQRINSVGGSRDIGAIAMGRATTLRSGIGGNAPTGDQITDLQGYVGAIDTWYQARRTAIENDIAAQKQAAQAIAQAQASAAQARIGQLQDELTLANSFKTLMTQAKQISDAMQLGTSNPLSGTGRLALANEEVQRLKALWDSSTGYTRIDAGNQLLQALQQYQSMGQGLYARSSPEWQAIYNQVQSTLAGVQGDAKPLAEQAVSLQREILSVQRVAASYQQMAANAGQQSSAELDDLNAQAQGYYTWAETEGARLYAIQRQEAKTQLMAITGGLDANLFIAQRTTEMRDLLKSINDGITRFLGAVSTTPGGGTTGTPAAGGSQPTVVVNVNGNSVSTADVVAAVRAAAPAIRRVLATS